MTDQIRLVRTCEIRNDTGDVYRMNEFSNGERATWLHRRGWASDAAMLSHAEAGSLDYFLRQEAATIRSIRIDPGAYSSWDWRNVTKKAGELSQASSLKDLLKGIGNYWKTAEAGLAPKLATAVLAATIGCTTLLSDKVHAKTPFFNDSRLRLYSDISVYPEIRGDQKLMLESNGLDLGVEIDNERAVKAFGSNLKLGCLNFRAIAEENEESRNYELKLRRKFAEELTAAAGIGSVDGKRLVLTGFNYKDLGNVGFDWGVDGGYVRLRGENKVIGDGWVNLKGLLSGRDAFFGARYDELGRLFLVASLPSDDQWALRFFRRNDLTEGDRSELNRLVFSTRARPTFMDESYSYFLIDVDAFRNTNTYIENPLRYIVPEFHHMGQGSTDGLEAVILAEFLKTPEGARHLRGEIDTYLTEGIWLGINGYHNLKDNETDISVPFGVYYKLGNLRVEPVYDLKERRLSTSIVIDMSYSF